MIERIIKDLEIDNHPNAEDVRYCLTSTEAFCQYGSTDKAKIVLKALRLYSGNRLNEIEKKETLKKRALTQVVRFGKSLACGKIDMDILYFKGDNHFVTCRLSGWKLNKSKNTDGWIGTISSLYEEIKDCGYVQVNYKFIVNIIHIVGMDSTSVYMDDMYYLNWGRGYYQKYKELLKDKRRKGSKWTAEKKKFVQCDL
jgi:hypothetical protein